MRQETTSAPSGAVTRDLLDELDPEQRRAAEAVTGPVCIVAGAGTGKTRTVTYRIAHAVDTGTVAAKHILALSHSTKAAGEMRHRLVTLGVGGVNARTFHAAALRQLRYFWAATGRTGDLEIVSSRFPLVRAAMEPRGKVESEQVFDVASEIGWAKSSLLTPKTYAKAAAKAGRSLNLPAADIAKIWAAYEKIKGGRVDFEDMLALTAELLETDVEVAERVRDQYRYFVVDEYQDVDPLQQRLLDAWLGGRDDICVVGDQRQTIFSFKAADASILAGFAGRYPHATVVALHRDYRSTPQVVDLANRVLPQHGPLIGQRPDGLAPQITSFYDEAAEESGVVSTIQRLHKRGVPLNEIAILFRFNANSARFEAALSTAGIPHQVLDSAKFFDRDEVRAVLVPFGKSCRSNPDATGIELLRDAAEDVGWDRDNPPGGAGAARARWEAITALVELVEAIPGVETLGASYLLAELQHRAAEAHDPTPGGVTLATMHKAKGLEWDAVFVVGCSDGAVPSTYATTTEQVEEERRLLYVAVTRAREHLMVTWPTRNGRGWKNKRSRFLDELAPTAPARTSTGRRSESAGMTGAVSGGKRFGECSACGSPLRGAPARSLRSCFGCLSGPGGAMRDRLVAWRAEVADHNGVDPTKVLTDAAIFSLVAGGDVSSTRGVGAAAQALLDELRAIT